MISKTIGYNGVLTNIFRHTHLGIFFRWTWPRTSSHRSLGGKAGTSPRDLFFLTFGDSPVRTSGKICSYKGMRSVRQDFAASIAMNRSTCTLFVWYKLAMLMIWYTHQQHWPPDAEDWRPQPCQGTLTITRSGTCRVGSRWSLRPWNAGRSCACRSVWWPNLWRHLREGFVDAEYLHPAVSGSWDSSFLEAKGGKI